MGNNESVEEDPYADERLEAPADFDGPTADRRCTDVIFAGLMLLCWAAMTAIGIYGWMNGDYRAIIYPMDYDGNICGTDFGNGTDMTNYTKIVYLNNFLGGVCVEECPSVEDLVDVRTLLTYNGVYQGEGAVLPADYVNVADYSYANNMFVCNEVTCDTDPAVSWTRIGISGGKGYAFYAVDTYDIFEMRCMSNPTAITKLKEIIQVDNDPLDINAWSSTKDFISNFYADVFETRYYIMFFGILAAMVVGFVYAQLLRFQPLLGIMIWGSVLGIIGIIFGVGALCFIQARDWKAADPQVRTDFDIRATFIFSYVLFGIGGIIVFLTIFLRKQIMLAMACVREAARAIGSMPLIVLFPVVQTAGLLAFGVMWMIYAVFLASTGDISEMEGLPEAISVREYKFDDLTRYCGWYLIFAFLWTIAFIQAGGQIVIAMSVAKWYFTRDKWEVGSGTVLKSICDTMRYHLGTAAFGSFIIAVTQLIRLIVAKAQKTARDMNNKIGEALLCCCQCCLWCFEKCVQFLNKNAYTQTAIFGTPFCKSAREAFGLITRNAGKVASITYVSSIVLFVGKVFISVLTTGAAYYIINRDLGDNIYSIGGPLAIIFVTSYFIGDMFLDIFDMSTTTILHCFVADEEMFDGDECYAEGKLRDWLDDFEERERKIVARID